MTPVSPEKKFIPHLAGFTAAISQIKNDPKFTLCFRVNNVKIKKLY